MDPMLNVGNAVDGLAADVSLDGLPRCGRCRILVELGDVRFGVEVAADRLTVTTDVDINTTWDFSYTMDEADWRAFCATPPPRGRTTAQAVVATAGAHLVRGDRAQWARYACVLDRVVAALRDRLVGTHPRHPDPQVSDAGLSPIVGRYVSVRVGATVRRIYFETAGTGQPVVCLHTAGADSRQYRHLLENGELTKRYQMIAFDMPWHGRSDPPDDWVSRRYTLDTHTYAETVLAFISEIGPVLGGAPPILMGCSMGGAIALYLASRNGDRFRGVCALEGGLGNPSRYVSWTNSLEADHSLFLTSWVGGLMSPNSPEGPRNQTLWGYAQSGPGVYHGDTHFYANDLPRFADSLGPARCPLYVFSGEYDYSATTEMSRAAVAKLGGVLVEMVGTGHFPMSEDPASFLGHLTPVLDEICGMTGDRP